MAIVCCKKIEKEMGSPVFWRDVVAEVICSTLLLTYITFLSVSFNQTIYKPNTTSSGIMVGFWVMILVETFGPICGAHMNPAVTFTMLLLRRISIARAIFYTLAACVGGVCGSYIVYSLTPMDYRAFQAFRPAEGLGAVRGMVVEVILTFMLCLVGASMTDTKRRGKHALPGLPVGFTVGVGIIATGTFTGACMNPIVALGPATISKDFTDHWIYWAGAYIGSFLAFAFYQVMVYIQSKFEESESNNNQSIAGDEKHTHDEVQRLMDLIDEKFPNVQNGSSARKRKEAELSEI